GRFRGQVSRLAAADGLPRAPAFAVVPPSAFDRDFAVAPPLRFAPELDRPPRPRPAGTSALASSSDSSVPSSPHAFPHSMHRLAPPRAVTTSPAQAGHGSGNGVWFTEKSHSG